MARKTRDEEQAIIEQAEAILFRRLKKFGNAMSSPADVKRYMRLKLAELEHEVFGIIWLNTQNQLIADEELFRGTLASTSVYPREVIKHALHHNAGACILYHNHPSGCSEPSYADKSLTDNLKNALAIIDVKVLDHIIVAGIETLSFAERGLV